MTNKISDATWIRLLNIVVYKLRKAFPYLNPNDLRSAASMGIVLAYKKYNPERTKNILGFITSKGYFMAYDILRAEFKLRSKHCLLHDKPIDSQGKIDWALHGIKRNNGHLEYTRTNPYQQTCDFEETIAHFKLAPSENQFLRERFLYGEIREKIAERRGISTATVSVRFNQILSRIRKSLIKRNDITEKQREELKTI